MEYTLISRSLEETIRYGRLFGACLEPGCVVGLVGELGAGKTCFVKGMALGINQTDPAEVTSPTFTILHEYVGSVSLYHFDAYRLAGAGDLEEIGFDDYIGGRGITVVEWADHISAALPQDCLMVHFAGIDESTRRITCRGDDPQNAARVTCFEQAVRKGAP